MTEYTNILITNRLATGTTFAVVQDKHDEQVFVPARTLADLDVKAGDVVRALLVPNAREPERTKWMAVAARVDKKKTSLEILVDRIVADLTSEGMATVEELTDTMQATTQEIEDALAKAVSDGRVTREIVYVAA